MKRIFSFIGFLCLSIGIAGASGNAWEPHYERINSLFIENKGQVADMAGNKRPDVLYTARSGQATLYFTTGGVYYVFPKHEKIEKTGNSPDEQAGPDYHISEVYRMDMQWVGANPGVKVVAQDKAESYSNYYYAHCPEGVEGVKHFRRLVYRNIYDRIDLVFYMSSEGSLKYDFIVHPGSDPALIKLKYIGADKIIGLSNGALEVSNPLGVLCEEPVYAYQTSGPGQTKVEGSYYVHENTVSYQVGEYDRAKPLVIDPLQRSYATYFGGNYDDYLHGSAADNDYIYFSFETGSTNLPVTTGAYQTSSGGGGSDSYIAKFSKSGSLSWATYYGGNGYDQGHALAIDKNGNIYHSGIAASSNFPVTSGAYQTSFGGSNDAFILKLNSSGTRQWATFFGGSAFDNSTSLVLDTAGDIYVGGYTFSSNFPVSSGAYQASIGSTSYADAFLAKFSSTGSMKWSTYVGGNNEDRGIRVNSDSLNNVWLAGQTMSSNFPVTSGTYQSSLGGGWDAYLAKFSAGGSRLWVTYYGGSGDDFVREMDYYGGTIAFAGHTLSSNFPVTSGTQSYGGNGDAFLTKFDLSGSRLFSTYYGGSSIDDGRGIAFDFAGSIYFAGYTASTNFPTTTGAYQASKKGGNDAFIAKHSSGTFVYSSYYGGTMNENVSGLQMSGTSICLVGQTLSSDFPVTSGAYQSSRNAFWDGFIVIFDEPKDTPTIQAKALKLSVNGCTTASVSWTKGDGEFRLVIAREGKAPDKQPGNKPYKANTTFGKGDDLGNGNYAVYADTGRTFTINGLTRGKTYYFTVYEYNLGTDAYYLKKNNPVDSVKTPKAQVDFTLSDSSLCLGDMVNLTNISTISAGTLTYTWYFGDGTQSTTTNPAVKYSSTGSFDIKLKAVSDKGCVDSMVRRVNINPVPKAGFAANNFAQCFSSNLFGFTDQTAIASGTVSYSWDFGDGAVSADKNPTHKYSTTGNFLVKLVVKSDKACSDSITKSVTVYPEPTAGFDVNANAQCLKGNNFSFSDKSAIGSGSLTYAWDFGDGNTSSQANPTHNYLAAGTFQVKLVVKSDKGCSDTISKTVTVHLQPVVGFGVNKLAQCLDGNSFVFADTSSAGSDALSYLWDFGDGHTSTQQNPVYSYGNAGGYDVTLTVTTNNGCQESIAKSVMVFPAVKAIFSMGNTCMNEPVIFANASGGSIVKYTWDFGDSSFSNAKNPKHSYSEAGAYTVSLVVTSSNGCTDTQTRQIVISDPSADFTFTKVTDSSYKFTAVSPDLQVWHWDFGDGQSSGEESPVHVFAKPGQYLVKLVGLEKGCDDSTFQLITIEPSWMAEANQDEHRFSVYPNPFNEQLHVSYTLSRQSYVTLEVVDILGRKVEVPATNQWQGAGEHQIVMERSSIAAAPGLLFIRLTINGQSYVKKAILTR